MSIKRVGKQERERKVLLGLVEHYIQTGKPVGSNALKEAGFEDLSSATIRNYFSRLEKEGLLTQSHSSGGRIPTDEALRVYAQTFFDFDPEFDGFRCPELENLRHFDSRETALFLQNATESLSQAACCAAFLSAPRFDHDFIVEMKLLLLDGLRCLCVMITDFGVIRTEILHLPNKLSGFAVKRIESYFRRRLTGRQEGEELKPEEEAVAQSVYNELLLRYIVSYSTFVDEDVYRTGFSRLLNYSEFKEAGALASGLSLFENVRGMRLLLKETRALERLKFWIGNDLVNYTHPDPDCSVIAIPYYINRKAVGAVGLLAPARISYRKIFKILSLFSESVSEALTRNIYKFKISFRQPEPGKVYLQKEDRQSIGRSCPMLLEDQSES